MPMTRPLRKILRLLPLVLLIGQPPMPALAAYEVQGLGFLGSWYSSLYDSSGFGINNNGQAVGRSYVTHDAATGREAFIWDPVALAQGLGDAAGGSFFSTAEAINDLGQVAGWGYPATGVQALFWSDAGGLLGLAGFSGTSAAYGINNAGQVVGKGRSANGEEAFVWSPSAGLNFLGDLPGGAYQSSAYDINDAGIVVGSSVTAAGWLAFVWDQANGLRALESLPGFSDCLARSINDESPAMIVGYCYSSTAAESCIWDAASGQVVETLGHLPDGSAKNYARSINDAGQIAGSSLAADGTSRPFITFSGSAAGLVELQDMITTPNWTLTEANGINNSGKVVGTGRDPDGRLQAFVLSPTACIPAAERCADAVDNDCDGRSDCEDADCAQHIDCRVCYDNLDCSWPSSGKYCMKPVGDCLAPGSCGAPPPADAPCAQALVCGCDGTTYPTPCHAARLGVDLFSSGSCCPDNDGDGFAQPGGSCGATDCNDLDAAVHPGAVEACDGKDNDCDGQVDEILTADTTAPTGSILINNGAAATGSTAVTLNLSAADGCGSGVASMRFRNSTTEPYGPWEPYQATRAWTLTGALGTKRVYAQFSDGAGNLSDANPVAAGAQGCMDSIVLADKTAPTGSVLINGGAASTGSTTVTLQLAASDTGGSGLASMRLRNGTLEPYGPWENFQATKSWLLPAGAGTKKVCAQFRDGAGNISDANPVAAGAQGYVDLITYGGP